MQNDRTADVFRYRVLIAVLLIAVFGLVVIAAADHVTNDFLKPIAHEVGVVLLISAVSAVLYEFYVRKDFFDKLEEIVRASTSETNLKVERLAMEVKQIESDIFIAAQCLEHGLSEIHANANTHDYKEMILSSRELYAIVNDGRGWISRNLDELTYRFQDPNKRTILILLHPDSSHLEDLAFKVDTDTTEIRNKILDSIDMICRSCPEEHLNSSVFVHGHRFFNTHTLFLNEGEAIVTVYFIAKGRGSVPLFRYEKGEGDSFYDHYKRDLDKVVLQSEDIVKFRRSRTQQRSLPFR